MYVVMFLLDKRKFIIFHLGSLKRAEEDEKSAERKKGNSRCRKEKHNITYFLVDPH